MQKSMMAALLLSIPMIAVPHADKPALRPAAQEGPRRATPEDSVRAVETARGEAVMRAENSGTYRDFPFSGKVRYTRVFVRRDGRWQAVAMQHTSMQ